MASLGWLNRPQLMTHSFVARRWLKRCVDALYPLGHDTCLLCMRPFHAAAKSDVSTAGLCMFCLQEIGATTQHPSWREVRFAVRSRHEHTLQRRLVVNSATTYEGIVRHAIRTWKYDGGLGLTTWFADLVVQDSRMRRGADVIVPVPTSDDRLRKRGYDHVGLLARTVGRQMALPVAPVLIRVRTPDDFTQSQTAKSSEERWHNLQGRFRAVQCEAVVGQQVLLLDDVITTGATVAACANALFRCGAQDVRAETVAAVL